MRLYASVLAILLVLTSPLLKAVVDISDAVMITLISTIGTIAATFTVTEYKKEKNELEQRGD